MSPLDNGFLGELFVVVEEAAAVLVVALAVEETATTAAGSARSQGSGGRGARDSARQSRSRLCRGLNDRENGEADRVQEAALIFLRCVGDGGQSQDKENDATHFELCSDVLCLQKRVAF